MKFAFFLFIWFTYGLFSATAQPQKGMPGNRQDGYYINNRFVSLQGRAVQHPQNGHTNRGPQVIETSCDSIRLTRQSQIDSFTYNYPGCTVARKIIIDGTGASPAITRLDSLKYITIITDTFSVKHTSVTGLSSLLSLVQVGGTLDIRYNPSLTGVGLNNLTKLGGLYLHDLPLLTSLAGISNNIDSIGGHIHIDSTGLTSLSGLNGITYVNGDVGIAHTPITSLSDLNTLQNIHYLKLESDTLMTSIGITNLDSCWGFLFSSLPHITSLGNLTYNLSNKHIGTFWFVSMPALTSLSGMDSIYGASNFYIWSVPLLTSLQGLHHLSGNSYGISLWGDNNLSNITALGNITNIVDGGISISNLGALTNLSGLGNITTIDNGLQIDNNSQITTLAHLNPGLVIHSIFGDSLRIFDNPLLPVCSVPAICNYLTSHIAGAEIHDNAPGCNDTTEILASCGGLNCTTQNLKTWNGSFSIWWNDSTNWTPVGVPQPCDSVLIPSGLTRYPKLSSVQTVSGLRMQFGSSLDQNGHNLNVYGNVVLDTATVGGSPGILFIKQSHAVIDFEGAMVFTSVDIQQYRGSLTFLGCLFNENVSVTDLPSRTGENHVSGNVFNNNFSITTNATNAGALTFFEDTDEDYFFGDVTFTVNTPVGLSIGANPLHAGGNFTVNSNFSSTPDISNGSVYFISGNNNDIHVSKTGTSRLTIGYIYTDKLGGTITLDQPLYVNHNVQFYGGIIHSDSSKLLVFKDGATINQYSSASYVDGPVRKIGSQAFRFPVGDSIYQGVCEISAPQNPADTVTAQYFKRNPHQAGYDTSQHASTLISVSGNEYWKLTYSEGPGGNNPTTPSQLRVTLSYDSQRSGPLSSIYKLRVAKWNGSQWLNEGASVISGNTSQAFVTSLSPNTIGGIYTLGFAPLRIPVITINPNDTTGCAGVPPVRIHYTLDTLMMSNNIMRLQLSDSSGSFSSPYLMGQIASNHSDSLFGNIPVLSPYGEHYKIRIVGDNPPDTSLARTFKVYPYPSSNLTIHGSSTACIGGGIYKYNVTPVSQGITYNWTLSEGGSFTTNRDTIYVTWTTPGVHSLTVTNSNPCITTGLAIFNVTVNLPPPTATPTLNNNGRWLFSSIPAANQNSLGYHWYRNDTLISGANNSSYYAVAAGSFRVKYYNLCGESPASNSISFAAASIPQTISFPAIPNKVYGDTAFVPYATASSGLPVFFTLVSGPASINPVTNYLTILGTGNVTVKATQQGNIVYDTAAPVTRTFTVNKAPQTITFPVISDKDISASASFTLNATASSGLPVAFAYVSGPATVSGNTVTLTGLGTVTIRASQNGDTNYLAAPNVDRSFCVRVSALNPIVGPNSICPGVNATYSVNNISGATYTWRIAGGATLPSTTNTVTTVWPTPGNYTLIVQAAGSCGSPSNNDSLAITAVTSAQPDSVHGMLPADGAINQQLPLALSWIPANPNLNYTFDIYLWRADTAQPATPYASNIHSVNYTIPVSANLIYNHAYKWMVVAHNGSCTQINTGPVQQFSLIPLSDLQPINVQAPATAFSGQTITINWTVKNNGPGSTGNKTWTDAVFFSFDSLPNFTISPETNPAAWNQLQFPIRPLLVGTKPNVSVLDSGQQYSNSINFTLPLHYGVPLYVYVIANYPGGYNAPLQSTYANDTARAPQPANVILSPQPDLRADTVFTPASTFTGSTINLTYKVKNYGVLTPAGSNWYDKMYISASPFFSVNNSIQLKFPKSNGSYYFNAPDAQVFRNSQLQHDSSYTINNPVVIPNFLTPGTYYIYVFTNATNSLYEGPSTNNNVNFNLIQVFLTPTPVLTVSSLTVPVMTASTTQTIGINWNIKNTGFHDNIEKNKGHYGAAGGTCTYPIIVCDPNGQNCYVSGYAQGIILADSLGWGSSYWKDKVYLSRDSVSLNINNAVFLGPYLHGGDRIAAMNAGYFSDIMPSPFGLCQPESYNPGTASINVQNVITPGRDFPSSLSFTVPDTLTQGNYYVYVYANPEHEVFEYPGVPQIRRSALPVAVQRPDAVVSSISAPGAATGGHPIGITFTVTNNGPGTVFNHVRNDKVYVSSSAVFDNSAQAIATFTYTENLPVGTGIQHTVNYTFPPATSGTRYIYVQTNYDSSFKETNLNNNVSTGAAVSVAPGSPADLVVSNITLADTVFTVFAQPFKYTVTNNGPDTASGSWIDSVFISCSPAFNPSTAFFITRRNQSHVLPSGSNYSDSFTIAMNYSFYINGCFPLARDANAYFFVKTNANAAVYEGSNTGNNITGSGLRDLRNPFPDHSVTSVSGADSATVGRPYSVSWTVRNLGYNPGPGYYYGWSDNFYFSPDSVYNANAVFVFGFGKFNPLNTNQAYTDSRTSPIPVLPTGDYYVMAYTNPNNNFFESNHANNVNLVRNGSGAAKRIHVTQPLLPDLTDSIVYANSSVAIGQPLTVTHRVTNKGSGSTYPGNWVDNIWLSADFNPGNGNDLLLYQKIHNGNLSPNQYYVDTITTIPVPPGYLAGNYIIIAQTNANGNNVESNTTNNLSFSYLNVFNPPPVDLQVENILKPDSVYLGYTIDTTKWTVFNHSPNTASGVTRDGIYLSRNTVLDSTAVLIGIRNKNINMGPLSRDTITYNPLATGVTEGNYNLLVKTDLINNIVETDENNNTNISATPIYVKVKPLPLNVLTASTLQLIPRYFRLRVPDSLIGSTILVTLKSNDSLLVNNQLYIGRGYIPSAAHFDYAYSTPNYGNQQIIMSSVTDTVYYITVNCTTGNSPLQNITLKAEVLPFAIVSVDANSGGNSGNVTIRITGSLFTNNMVARLTRTGTTIYSSAVYYSNSTMVFATFNLQGKPLGIYDVKLVKPDSSVATLVNGFSVVLPNNGGILTGGGINTGPGNGNQPGCDPGAAAGLNSQLSIEMVLPEKAFGGWPFVIAINYNNPTNNDIPAQTRVLYSLDNLPVAATQAGLNSAGPSLYMVLTEQNGPPGIIRAGGSGSIIVYSRAPVSYPAHTLARYTIR